MKEKSSGLMGELDSQLPDLYEQIKEVLLIASDRNEAYAHQALLGYIQSIDPDSESIFGEEQTAEPNIDLLIQQIAPHIIDNTPSFMQFLLRTQNQLGEE